MNVNLNQFTSMNTKQEPVKANKTQRSNNREDRFSYSMEKSLNSLKNKKTSSKKNDIKDDKRVNRDKDDKYDKDDKDDEKEELKSLLYLIDFINSDTNDGKNIFDIDGSDIEIDEDILANMLSKLGVDMDKINAKKISREELLEGLAQDKLAFEKIIEELNLFKDTKMMNDKELLNNIKNEISNKINNLENNSMSSLKSQEHFNSLNMDKSANNILKEISGDGGLNNNINMQFLDNIRNIDSKNFEEIYSQNLNTNINTKFVEEFIDSIKYMRDNNKTEMIVKLNPESLGKMDIKYESVKDSVRLLITVETQEALKIMTNSINDIKNMIKENHQVNLDNIQVDLNQFGFNSDDQNSNSNKNNNEKSKNTIRIDDEEVKIDNKDVRSGVLV